MRSTFLLLATAAAFAATPAFAQDEASSFTGPRIEATFGYDSTQADGLPTSQDSVHGVRVGGAIGYDLPIGSTFTIGAEAGIGWQVSGSADALIGGTNLHLTTGRDLDASLRLGAKVAPSTLLYVKAGYANSQFRLRSTTGGTVTHVSTNEDGYRLGAGVEQMLGDHLYAKAEYRFSDYGDDVSRHQVLLGAGYRF
ncbi:MAG: porin family protein [Sphingomonas sp.]|jgi:outer membrane immunogenic protein|uniref:outer membrane protein n=1 Tax=Sphingomonas sp. TaxID=28214 RepID=UPI003563527A